MSKEDLISNPLYADFCIRTTDNIIIPCHRVFFHDIPLFRTFFTVYEVSPGYNSIEVPGTQRKVQLIRITTTQKLFRIVLDMLYLGRIKISYIDNECTLTELLELYMLLKMYFHSTLNETNKDKLHSVYLLISRIRLSMKRKSSTHTDPEIIKLLRTELQSKWNVSFDDRLYEEVAQI